MHSCTHANARFAAHRTCASVDPAPAPMRSFIEPPGIASMTSASGEGDTQSPCIATMFGCFDSWNLCDRPRDTDDVNCTVHQSHREFKHKFYSRRASHEPMARIASQRGTHCTAASCSNKVSVADDPNTFTFGNFTTTC